jgi:hypothetical protein
MDGAARDFEIDVAIGMDSAKTLVDADQFDGGLSHAAVPIVFLSLGQK